MAADGSELRQIVSAPAETFFWPVFSWSPDGQWIAYGDDTLELVRPDGSERRTLGPGTMPVWSPDGRRIASVLSEGDLAWIQIMYLDGSDTTRLTAGAFPSWSPDGTRLAFCDLGGEDEVLESEVLVIRDNGSDCKRLCSGWLPRWSPAGDRILVQRLEGAEVVTIAPDGSDERLLAAGALSGHWSPDGHRVLLNRGGKVSVIQADGAGERFLDLPGTDRASDP